MAKVRHNRGPRVRPPPGGTGGRREAEPRAESCDPHDLLSDEIEIARGAEQLATELVDRTVGIELAARRIDVLDLLPLRVILSRHVASLEEILETFNAL